MGQDLVITEEDCGTINGLQREAIVQGGEVVIPLADRILGRSVAEAVVSPVDGQQLLPANGIVEEETVSLFEEHNVNQVLVRSPVTCETRYGVCSSLSLIHI